MHVIKVLADAEKHTEGKITCNPIRYPELPTIRVLTYTHVHFLKTKLETYYCTYRLAFCFIHVSLLLSIKIANMTFE